MTMKLYQIDQINKALKKLAETDLPIAYELAKNIRACETILDESNEIARELHSRFADKNEKGELIQYPQDGKEYSRITDTSKALLYTHELAKIEAVEHDIKLVPISKTIFEGKQIPGLTNLLIPLIGTIIID